MGSSSSSRSRQTLASNSGHRSRKDSRSGRRLIGGVGGPSGDQVRDRTAEMAGRHRSESRGMRPT